MDKSERVPTLDLYGVLYFSFCWARFCCLHALSDPRLSTPNWLSCRVPPLCHQRQQTCRLPQVHNQYRGHAQGTPSGPPVPVWTNSSTGTKFPGHSTFGGAVVNSIYPGKQADYGFIEMNLSF
jgi:hypothetical protein